MNQRRRAWAGHSAWLCLPVFLSACREAVPQFSRAVVGDTVLVLNERPRIADTAQLREVGRIGSVEGPDEYVFSQIYSLAVGGAGDVYVQDRGAGIRRFDSEGRYLESTAGWGQGPDEVEYVISMTFSEQGLLAAYDVGNARITVFDSIGAVRHVRRPPGVPRYGEDGVVWMEDGRLALGVNPTFPSEGGIGHPRPVFAMVSEDGTLVDTVFTPANAADGCPVLSERAYWAGFWEDKREPWVPKVKWTLGSDGTLAVGCPADYEFALWEPGGRVVKVRREWQPTFASEEELGFFQTFGGMPRLPNQRPAFTRIILPGAGRVWVWRSGPSTTRNLGSDATAATGLQTAWEVAFRGAFDVFNDTGEWVGVVKMPEEVRYSGYRTTAPVVIRGDTLWAVAYDDMDVEYVVRYQVMWPEIAGG